MLQTLSFTIHRVRGATDGDVAQFLRVFHFDHVAATLFYILNFKEILALLLDAVSLAWIVSLLNGMVFFASVATLGSLGYVGERSTKAELFFYGRYLFICITAAGILSAAFHHSTTSFLVFLNLSLISGTFYFFRLCTQSLHLALEEES